MSALPVPDEAAQAQSQRLSALLHQQIAAGGGWLSFAEFMHHALYAPGLGYYSAGSRKFGPHGDFVTAPEMTPLFAQSLASTVAAVLRATGGEVLEIGAGSGQLALDLLLALEAQNALPARYAILEVSADLAQRQRDTLAAGAPHLLARVTWLSALPEDFCGIMLGNEVLDAMPCHLLYQHAAHWLERGVVADGAGFAWQDRPLADARLAAAVLAHDPPDDYLTEVQPAAQAFVRSLAGCMRQGVLLLVDYGFPAAEYYHPQRHRGTLMCHYRHHSHADPFFWPGLQDITTHVDFSAIWAAATEAGWQLEGYTSQASYLLDAGLLDALAALPSGTPAYFQAAAAAQKLVSPAEMGELFKVIAFSRHLELDDLLPGFGRDDRSAAL